MRFLPRSHLLDCGIDRKSVKVHSGTLQHFNNGFRATEAHKPCLLLVGGMLLEGFLKVKGLYVVVELAVRVDARVNACVMLLGVAGDSVSTRMCANKELCPCEPLGTKSNT
jgi:hypothetical protein